MKRSRFQNGTKLWQHSQKLGRRLQNAWPWERNRGAVAAGAVHSATVPRYLLTATEGVPEHRAERGIAAGPVSGRNFPRCAPSCAPLRHRGLPSLAQCRPVQGRHRLQTSDALGAARLRCSSAPDSPRSSSSWASRSSAFARMMPSWLFNRWKRVPSSVGLSVWGVSMFPGRAVWRCVRLNRRQSTCGASGGAASPRGSRQSVSANIRTEPPAVRTYSTLPPAIQL